MGKAIKTLLIIAGVLLSLFVLAAVILVATVDPNEYKGEIAQAVKENTGRELTFEGDIGFNFFPWLGLKVGPMALGNAAGFSPAEMVRINTAEASIQIMPLFTGNVQIGMIVLDGLTVNLAKNAQGVTNWDDLTKGGDKAEAMEAGAPAKSASGDGGGLESISLEGVEITNTNIVYDDQMEGKKTAINNLKLIVGEFGSGTRSPFELSLDLKLDDPKIETRPVLSGFATFNQTAGTMEIEELKFTALNLELTGKFFAGFKDKVSYSGELALTEMSVKKLMQELSMEPLVTADPKALEAVSADIKLNGTDTSVGLEKMTVKLDDTTISIDGSVKNFDKPAITFAVNIDDIDADRYMPPKAEGEDQSEQAATEPAPASQEPAEEPDLSGLKELDLQARLTVGKLKAMNLKIAEILCELVAKNGVVTVKPFSAKLYDGTLDAHSVLNVNPKLATWKEGAEVKGIQAGPLLKDLTGKAHLEGGGVLKYDLSGAGLTPDNIKRTVSGTASFAFTDGAINGVNVAKMIRDGWNKLKGKPAGPDEAQKTDFAELLGSATLDKGHIVNKDLLMKSPLLRLIGEGWANLPGNNVDYLATATVVGTLKGQDGASMEDLKGLALPVRVKGDLDKPDISLDMAAFAKALFGDSIKKGTKALEKTLKDSILGGGKKSDTTDDKKDSGIKNPLKSLF